MKATLKNYSQPPRKTRLVTDLVRGKRVPDALLALKFLEKRAAAPIAKLISSAAANAEKQGENTGELVVRSITVDKGLVRTKFMPRAFGKAAPIKRRMSHVTVLLGKTTASGARKQKKKKNHD